MASFEDLPKKDQPAKFITLYFSCGWRGQPCRVGLPLYMWEEEGTQGKLPWVNDHVILKYAIGKQTSMIHVVMVHNGSLEWFNFGV